jgi:hypothetical protein
VKYQPLNSRRHCAIRFLLDFSVQSSAETWANQLDHREFISVPCTKCILSVYLIRSPKKK